MKEIKLTVKKKKIFKLKSELNLHRKTELFKLTNSKDLSHDYYKRKKL